MAYSTTRLDEYRTENMNLDAAENRLSNYGALETFIKDTPNLLPGAAEFAGQRKTEDRTVSYAVMARTTLASGTARTCTASTDQGTSAYVTPSWSTYYNEFMTVPAEHANNYISYQRNFNHLATSLERDALSDLDTAAISHLNTNKSQVNASDGNPYTVTSNVMIVPSANIDEVFNELQAILKANSLPADSINVIGSVRTSALVNKYINQGVANSTNYQYQFGPYNFAYSNQITAPTGYRDTIYAAPSGSLGFLNWVGPDFKANRSNGDKSWTTEMMPRLGFDVELLYQNGCTDKSAIWSGGEASYYESWGFSFDYSFVSSYNSAPTTYAGVIYRADLSKT
jgi:hypothetical protein